MLKTRCNAFNIIPCFHKMHRNIIKPWWSWFTWKPQISQWYNSNFFTHSYFPTTSFYNPFALSSINMIHTIKKNCCISNSNGFLSTYMISWIYLMCCYCTFHISAHNQLSRRIPISSNRILEVLLYNSPHALLSQALNLRQIYCFLRY